MSVPASIPGSLTERNPIGPNASGPLGSTLSDAKALELFSHLSDIKFDQKLLHLNVI